MSEALLTNDPRRPSKSSGPAGEQTSRLRRVVGALCQNSRSVAWSTEPDGQRAPLPSRDALREMVLALRSVLFPGYFGASELNADSTSFHVGYTLDRVLSTLREQIYRGLCFALPNDAPARAQRRQQADEIAGKFLDELPAVQQLLLADVQAAYEGDPAATSPDEAIFCYPGVLALISHRIAHELHRLGVPLIPRIINEHAHSVTGIDIHPGARIGRGLFIDHGTGVVVGETSIIGDRVRIYQGVTLGAKSFPLDDQGNPIKAIPRHPIVEDDVIIYAGATILGRVVIGQGSVIGGNVWLVRSVPPRSRITQSAVRKEEFVAGAGI